MATLTPAAALERLMEGNRRFVAGAGRAALPPAAEAPQRPIAIVLGCADARVPAEIVFDQGPGDLFVVRVAGNVVAPTQIGSAEFAAEQFGCRLVVVLGHTRCGAVQATLAELARPSEDRSPNLRSIVERIAPAIEPLLEEPHGDDPDALLGAAVKANIRAAAADLRAGSPIIERLIESDGLRIVAAEYALHSGEVSLLED